MICQFKRSIVFTALLLMPLSVFAQQVLYATQACGRNCEPLQSGLYTINPSTGEATFVADTGESITGLDFHPTTGVLYGTTTPGSPNPSSLITINPSTGAVNVIGAHGLDEAIIDLTFAPDGTLYGWLEPGSDDVVTIDLGNGQATVVGESNTNTGGCAFDLAPNGYLYLWGGYCESEFTQGDDGYHVILEIDPADGSVVDAWDLLQDDSQSCPGWLGWNAASHDAQGNVYGFRRAGCGGPERELATVNLATGETSTVGDSLDWASGLAWGGPVEVQPVPTFSQYATWIAIALVGLLGLAAYRRRQTA